MNVNSAHTHNQSYWFVVREDQNNVVISSNNFPNHGSQSTERYEPETGNVRHYVQPAELSIDEEPASTVEVTTRRSREDPFWDKHKTRVFLSICANNKYRNWDPKDTEMWKEIAPVIGTSPNICYRKYLSLKSTFVRLYKKKLLGKNVKWFCFNLCEEVFKDNKFMYADLDETWEDNKIQQMLLMYIDLFSKFKGNTEERKQCWRQIAESLGTTDFNCIRKFKDLRRSYIGIVKRTRITGKVVKWPYLSYFQRIYREGIRLKDKWDKDKVKLLLSGYSERIHRFADPKCTKKDLWIEIANTVGLDASECDKKFRNLKVTYMRLKEMENSGQFISKWRHYKFFEEINNTRSLSEDDQFFTKKLKGDPKIIQLLEFYIEHKEKFMNPLITNKSLWKVIGSRLKLTSDECDKKFRNLKQSYVRIVNQQSRTGKPNHWPYYTYFEQIYDRVATSERITVKKQKQTPNVEDLMVHQMKKMVDSVQEPRDSNRKFDRLMKGVEESNNLQRERNNILLALLDRYN